MHQTKAKILSNKKIILGHYKISLYAPEIAREVKPGQFVHIRVKEGYDPLLRRPFSIHKSRNGRIEILYKVVGRGTELLAGEKRGQKIDILGPLGQGFEEKADFKRIILKYRNFNNFAESLSSKSSQVIAQEKNGGSRPKAVEGGCFPPQYVQRIILVAGGIGIAPLYFLAEKLVGNDIFILLGAETKKKILCLRDLRDLPIKVKIATEDGSQGYKGLVSDFLFHFFQKSPRIDLICACGPFPMLKKIAQLSLRYKIPCYVSLEQRMGCGIGVCRGCIIKGQNGYLRVCRDGPVFNAQQILWEDLD